MDIFKIEEVKIHLEHESRGKLEYVNCTTHGSYICLEQNKISHVSSNLGRLEGRPYTEPFFSIRFSLGMDTRPKYWWNIFNRVWVERPQIVGVTTSFLKVGLNLTT